MRCPSASSTAMAHALLGELPLHEDPLRVADNPLGILAFAARCVEADDEDVGAVVVRHTGEQDPVGLDLGSQVGRLDFDAHLHCADPPC